jgi:hypothetical protein
MMPALLPNLRLSSIDIADTPAQETKTHLPTAGKVEASNVSAGGAASAAAITTWTNLLQLSELPGAPELRLVLWVQAVRFFCYRRQCSDSNPLAARVPPQNPNKTGIFDQRYSLPPRSGRGCVMWAL